MTRNSRSHSNDFKILYILDCKFISVITFAEDINLCAKEQYRTSNNLKYMHKLYPLNYFHNF